MMKYQVLAAVKWLCLLPVVLMVIIAFRFPAAVPELPPMLFIVCVAFYIVRTLERASFFCSVRDAESPAYIQLLYLVGAVPRSDRKHLRALMYTRFNRKVPEKWLREALETMKGRQLVRPIWDWTDGVSEYLITIPGIAIVNAATCVRLHIDMPVNPKMSRRVAV